MSQVSPNSGVMLADERTPPEVALSEEDREALARGHFTVRRLERTYGTGTVRVAYEQIRRSHSEGR